MEKLTRLTGKPESFFEERAQHIGSTLARSGAELWVNSDRGMLYNVASSYRENKGVKLVVLFPASGHPWPNAHAEAHVGYADEVMEEPSWFETNYKVVSEPDFCVCVGLSAGTLSELAYIKWNCQFQKGNLRRLYVVQELVRGETLPLEIEEEVESVLKYVKTAEELEQEIARDFS
ncbi:MAG: hypothetical protein U1C72_00295 [Candidatus Pacearchaeota archaeon]|nr:hypothetical protein [Candidatus Pacearchaeota archaeon]